MQNFLKLFIIGILSLFLFESCSGPARYSSKNDNRDYSTKKIDSTRIAQKLREVIDTSDFNRNDLEFTEDELEEEKLANETSVNISVDEFIKKYKLDTTSPLPNQQEKLIMAIISYLGTPYKYGGITRRGIDCSAFTLTVFSEVFNIDLPRSASQQYQVGEVVEGFDDLKFGDLVFFNTRRRQVPGHVGIYLWDKLFAHASSTKGVIISSMAEGYYYQRYMSARRLIN